MGEHRRQLIEVKPIEPGRTTVGPGIPGALSFLFAVFCHFYPRPLHSAGAACQTGEKWTALKRSGCCAPPSDQGGRRRASSQTWAEAGVARAPENSGAWALVSREATHADEEARRRTAARDVCGGADAGLRPSGRRGPPGSRRRRRRTRKRPTSRSRTRSRVDEGAGRTTRSGAGRRGAAGLADGRRARAVPRLLREPADEAARCGPGAEAFGGGSRRRRAPTPSRPGEREVPTPPRAQARTCSWTTGSSCSRSTSTRASARTPRRARACRARRTRTTRTPSWPSSAPSSRRRWRRPRAPSSTRC